MDSLSSINAANGMMGESAAASAEFVSHDDDSIERPTILGAQLTNPY